MHETAFSVPTRTRVLKWRKLETKKRTTCADKNGTHKKM